MTSIVSLSCNVAEIHHQYASIHEHLFGAVSLRKIFSAIKGNRAKAYKESMESLEQLQKRLKELETNMQTADAGSRPHKARLMRETLSEYITALDSVIASLRAICTWLSKDEDAYRYSPEGKQSMFSKDKIRYDQELMSLEQQGKRLNKLFSQY